jgi:hypothetical protein
MQTIEHTRSGWTIASGASRSCALHLSVVARHRRQTRGQRDTAKYSPSNGSWWYGIDSRFDSRRRRLTQTA